MFAIQPPPCPLPEPAASTPEPEAARSGDEPATPVASGTNGSLQRRAD